MYHVRTINKTRLVWKKVLFFTQFHHTLDRFHCTDPQFMCYLSMIVGPPRICVLNIEKQFCGFFYHKYNLESVTHGFRVLFVLLSPEWNIGKIFS